MAKIKKTMESFCLWSNQEYDSFISTGYSVEAHFNSQVYIQRATERFRAEANFGRSDPLLLAVRLSLISAGGRTKDIAVLDFGGGLGSSLRRLSQIDNRNHLLRYHNLDNDAAVKAFNLHCLNELNGAMDNIVASASSDLQQALHELGPAIEILNLGSCMQYIERPAETIATLCDKFDPRIIILDDVYLAERPFITTQLFFDLHEVPFRFTCHEEIDEIANMVKGTIIYEGLRIPTFRGGEYYDVSRLPVRIKHNASSVFLIERQSK